MFIPNTFGMLSKHLGRNQYSEPSFAAPKRTACAVVKMDHALLKTSVRVDQSASRGNIEENTVVAVLLFKSDVTIASDDVFEILGFKIRVMGVQPRNSVLGRLDHYEVTFGVAK